MNKEIIIAVLSTVIAALVLYIGGSMAGLLKLKIIDSQLNELVSKIVKEEKFKEALIDKMKSIPDFKGDNGESYVHEPNSKQSQISAARAICYSALPQKTNHSLIMLPLPSNTVDLDAECHKINYIWHAGGIAKGRYFNQDCSDFLDNEDGGDGGYTSFVTESYFEDHRNKFKKCGKTNAFICCSPQFDN